MNTAATHLFVGVPMTWTKKWAGGFPLGFDDAHGAPITGLDGHEVIDLARVDTGARAGHFLEALEYL